MKGVIFDENIPKRILFLPTLPFSHVTDIGVNPSDTFIWEHARKNELVIVTKDADFSNRIMLSSPPPWIVHLRFGNMKRKEFHAFLAHLWPQIEALIPSHRLINVYTDRIEAVKG